MSVERCPGSGQKWTHDGRYETCPSCGTPAIDFNYEPTYEPVTVPAHVICADRSVWAQIVGPKPPEPDPWAVALHDAWCGDGADLIADTPDWEKAHRVAARARGLAGSDSVIRAGHWREAARFVMHSACTCVERLDSAAVRIEKDGQP